MNRIYSIGLAVTDYGYKNARYFTLTTEGFRLAERAEEYFFKNYVDAKGAIDSIDYDYLVRDGFVDPRFFTATLYESLVDDEGDLVFDDKVGDFACNVVEFKDINS